MMKVLALISFFLAACFLAAPAKTPDSIFPYEYEISRLPNGFTSVLIPMDNPGLVAYYSIVRTGSRDEYEPGHSGFAHFFEHMMFRGTNTYPGDVYDKMITEMGADANAYTSSDYTCYHLVLATEDLEKVMGLESDRFQNLSYNDQAFKTEAGAVHGEYLKSLSSPWSVLYEKLLDTAFERHTYKHSVIGFKNDIEAMPTMYAYSLSFYDRYYRPENVILLIAGDIDTAQTRALIQKYYGSWEKGYIRPAIPPEPEQLSERKTEVSFQGRTLPILCVAYKGLAYAADSREMAACELLGELSFGETSDIYKKLVINEQRLQFIRADFSASRDPGLMTIMTMVKEENDIANIEAEIYTNIQKFQTQPVEEQRLTDLKNNIKYSFLMGLDTADETAGHLAGIIALTGGIDAVDRLYRTYAAITPEDIVIAAKKFLVEQKRTVVVLKGGR